ncbi:MAG: hypothetical protein K2X81_09840, partial [Candidatus Obscuribacterales bacterium]|nr:hypothetical protein [Candidatus Obscuribacterales bacterium]
QGYAGKGKDANLILSDRKKGSDKADNLYIVDHTSGKIIAHASVKNHVVGKWEKADGQPEKAPKAPENPQEKKPGKEEKPTTSEQKSEFVKRDKTKGNHITDIGKTHLDYDNIQFDVPNKLTMAQADRPALVLQRKDASNTYVDANNNEYKVKVDQTNGSMQIDKMSAKDNSGKEPSVMYSDKYNNDGSMVTVVNGDKNTRTIAKDPNGRVINDISTNYSSSTESYSGYSATVAGAHGERITLRGNGGFKTGDDGKTYTLKTDENGMATYDELDRNSRVVRSTSTFQDGSVVVRSGSADSDGQMRVVRTGGDTWTWDTNLNSFTNHDHTKEASIRIVNGQIRVKAHPAEV